VLQDWQEWLKEGILDLGVPMNYDTDSKTQQQQWFDQWLAFEKTHAFDRQLVIGLGAFMNDHDGTTAQIRRALTPTSAGQNAVGVSFFSYHQTSARELSYEQFARALTQTDDAAISAVFSDWARTPDVPWKMRPTSGYLRGFVREADGSAADGVSVQLAGPVNRVLTAAGTGFFGALNLPVGVYRVSVLRDGHVLASRDATVSAGNVASADFALATD